MRALVTGGAGFIGSNLVDALLERGDEVTVVDNITTGRRENLSGAGAELVEADIRDGEAMSDLVARVAPEAIFHLAAQVDVRRSAADPAFDAGVNVVGTINMLEAARATGTPRFVNASTGGAIYGEPEEIPAPESHPNAPEAPYGQSKFAAEGYLDLYRRLHGLSTVSTRFGNVYGPRQDPLGEAGVIAIFCGKLLEGEPATIFGDGRQTRDYVYVGDVVAAVLAAGASEHGGAFNVGMGVQTDLLEVAEVLREVSGKPFEVEHAPERPGEVRHIALDASRARDELGWRAEVSVREGLERTLEAL
ncbi:MAG: GDP-mannose 4,6-dehydratase [Thermoleophilaceae bacterium]|nr:GDP-mannose 4,6-dehydratase [Thermoleophilaceae bacterium]